MALKTKTPNKVSPVTKKEKTPKKAAPPKKVEEEEDSSDESDEEAAPAVVKGKKAAAAANADDSDREESSAEDEEGVNGAESDDDEEDEEDEDNNTEEEENPAVKGKKQESDDEEESSEEESEEEAAPAKKSARTAAAEQSDEDSDEEEEDEEEMEPDSKKAAKRKADYDESEEESSEEGSSEEEEEDDEDCTTVKVTGFDKMKKLKKFMSSNQISIISSNANGNEYVLELATAADVKKAIALSVSSAGGSAIAIVKHTGGVAAKAEKSTPPAAKKQRFDENTEDRTLFVKGFPHDCTEEQLRAKFPEAENIDIIGSKGFGFVLFPSEEDLFKYKDVVHCERTIKIGSCELQCDFKGKKSVGIKKRDQSLDEPLTMFVGSLSYDVDEDTLRETFPNAKNIRIPLSQSGDPRGFAFVTFHTEQDVENAITEKDGTEVAGRAISLDFMGAKAKKRGGGKQQQGGGGGGGSGSSLIIRNLSYDTEADSLREVFTKAANVKIIMDRDTGRSKGFGFIDFDSQEDAQEALSAKQGTEVDGREISLDFSSNNSGGGRGGGRGRGGRGGGFGGGRGGGGGGGGRGGRGGRGGGRGGFGGGRGGGGRGGRGGGGHAFGGGNNKKKTFDD